jgi:steroid 5-alpha reductase family enzyme
MDTTLQILAWNLITVTIMMVAGWLVSLRYKNVTLVDSLWGIGFVVIAWLTFALSDGYSARSLLLAGLTTVWGLRLSIYLTRRNHGKGEDPRYGAWRRQYGNRFWIVSLFNVFLVQALFLWVIALATQLGQMSPVPARLTWLDGLGAFVWATGFIFETVGDWQLARFKADPAHKGRVMDRGLWAYSRHPNYFGEALIWWGIFLIVLATPDSLWTVISPALITITLLKITGIALTEKTILEKRPEYREYIDRTSAFVPWFPKRRKDACMDRSCRSGDPD